MTSFFPIMLDIENKLCVIIGGGNVATRKILLLLQYGAKIEVISPLISDTLLDLVNKNEILWKNKDYYPGIIPECFMIFAATNQHDINNLVAIEAKSKGILINIVDCLEDSEIIIPSIHKIGDLSVAISTNGKSPLLAKKIKEEVALKYDNSYSLFLNILEEIRLLALNTIESKPQRKKLFEKILNSTVFDLIKSDNMDSARNETFKIYKTFVLKEKHEAQK